MMLFIVRVSISMYDTGRPGDYPEVSFLQIIIIKKIMHL